MIYPSIHRSKRRGTSSATTTQKITDSGTIIMASISTSTAENAKAMVTPMAASHLSMGGC